MGRLGSAQTREGSSPSTSGGASPRPPVFAMQLSPFPYGFRVIIFFLPSALFYDIMLPVYCKSYDGDNAGTPTRPQRGMHLLQAS